MQSSNLENSAPPCVDSSQEPKWTSSVCFPNGKLFESKFNHKKVSYYVQTCLLLPKSPMFSVCLKILSMWLISFFLMGTVKKHAINGTFFYFDRKVVHIVIIFSSANAAALFWTK